MTMEQNFRKCLEDYRGYTETHSDVCTCDMCDCRRGFEQVVARLDEEAKIKSATKSEPYDVEEGIDIDWPPIGPRS